MQNEPIETTEQKGPRRFESYEDFLRAFYPTSAETEIAKAEEEATEDFGTNLAIDSLNRHADILKFGHV